MSTAATPSIQEYFALVAEPLHRVKDSLLAVVPPDSMVLAETVQQSLTSGGKYMRPVMTLLIGAATSPDKDDAYSQKMVEVAAVTEMIHVATLLHDDVIDESELRRGKPTVRSAFGNRISVLSGDYLLAQASLKLSRLDNCRLVSIFACVLADLCDGEVEQLHTSYTLNISWDSYYKKTICKTASLFSAGCESAGVINGLPEERIRALRLYGRNVGIAFQIMDDLLDYTATEAEMGKPVLDDLRNGLLNAPVLLALQSDNLDAEERAELQEHIHRLFEEASAKQPVEAVIEQIRHLLDKARAIEETRALAADYVRQACEALDFVPESAEKSGLLALAHYVLDRRS